MALDSNSHGRTVNTTALQPFWNINIHTNLGKGTQDDGGLRQVHSNEAYPPDSRHTTSYMEYQPFHVLSIASHARVHAPYPPLIPLNGRRECRAFLCAVFGIKGASHLLMIHLMTHLSNQSTPLVPRYLGDPLIIESPVSYQWPMLDLPLLVIGASLFIYVPGF